LKRRASTLLACVVWLVSWAAGRAGGPCCRLEAIDTRAGIVTIRDHDHRAVFRVRLAFPHSAAALGLRVGMIIVRWESDVLGADSAASSPTDGPISFTTGDGVVVTGTVAGRLSP
jgi:hypothetical protein